MTPTRLVGDGPIGPTIQRTNIDIDGTAAQGDNTIVAAQPNHKIRVLAIAIFPEGANQASFNDGTAELLGGTNAEIQLDPTGAAGAGGFVLNMNDAGWLQTAERNRPLNLNLAQNQGVCGVVVWMAVRND